MITRIINWSLDNRFLVILVTLVMMGLGIYSATRLPLDAVPDLTNVQVQVLTNAPALGPVEVEQFITFPIENSLSGLPRISEIRSVSRIGLSAITVVFEDGTDIYWARNLISERLQQARSKIPAGIGEPQMGPIATGMSEIFQFEVRPRDGYNFTLMELRTILDWQIAFQLRSVPGVIEVNTAGGEAKTFEVQIDPDKLLNYNISLSKIFNALAENNGNAGGGYIIHGAEQRLIRAEGLVTSLEDIRNILLDSRDDGTPIRISDIANVCYAPMLRQGAVTRDGVREAVTGTVMMLMGANSHQVVHDVKLKIKEIQGSLPPGVWIEPFYDRTELVEKTIATIGENIGIGILLVVIMLFLLMGDFRAGLIVASAIPMSALLALTAMHLAGVSANLMSLGAIDFGVIVDGAVVMVENAVRHASRYGKNHPNSRVPMSVFRESASEVGGPILFAGIIVITVFIPILTLQGIEGKMFRPMAFTFISALTGALILTVTVIPVLASLFLVRKIQERDTLLMRGIKSAYIPLLDRALTRPRLLVGFASGLFAVSVAIAFTFGVEFVPKLDEGDLAVQATRLPSVSLETSNEMTKAIERTLLEFPQVSTVISKTGRPEIANDPMGVHQTDVLIRLKPVDAWPEFLEKEALVGQMEKALKERVPSNAYSFSQPIELRVQELIAGVRSTIGISLYGDDLGVLKTQGDRVAQVLAGVPGAADVQAQQIAGLSYLRVIIKRDQIARYGINSSAILDAISVIGGKIVGEVYEGQRRFPIQVRLGPEWRTDLDKIRQLKIDDPMGRQIPITQLADLVIEEGPSEIGRHSIRRRLIIQCNVRGRDLSGFVNDAQRTIGARVKLPEGYFLVWGGQFQNLREASNRLMIAVPIALFLIFALLFMTFNSARMALLIYLNVPIAATGGVLVLWMRGMPFSISAGVGFIALFGIAVMNGVVLIEHIRHLRKTGLSVPEAVRVGSLDRLRPVLMTATCGALGFVPMAISTSAGAEVQRPLATVVIGGLVTSTILTLLMLPAIYRWFDSGEPAASQTHDHNPLH